MQRDHNLIYSYRILSCFNDNVAAKSMKLFIRNFVLNTLVGVAALVAQQDSTVQWKTVLQDLEQRLTGLPAQGEAVDSWRADAEALRDCISSFASANPALKG
jgi:hypothetical protein